jgi:hypothetical protein
MMSWDVGAALEAERGARELIERDPEGTLELQRALEQSVSDRANGEAPDADRLRALADEARRSQAGGGAADGGAVNTAERRYGRDESPA